MSSATTTDDALDPSGPDWTSAAAAGLIAGVIVGLVVWVGFDPDIIKEDIPDTLGGSGIVIGWGVLLAIGLVSGLIYGGLNAIPQIDAWASTPQTGAVLGLVYGTVLWIAAVIVVPLIDGAGLDGIGDYALTAEGFLAYALFGVIIGFTYLLVPVLRSR